jgi:EmrB/QacA subfamily drug resistance transporter
MAEGASLRYDEPAGRWTLWAMVLGTCLAFLDGTVVNIAIPSIGEDLDATAAGLQWTLNGYTLTLAAFILLGGSLGDRYGRRRIYLVGVVWFAAASLLCGIAPNIESLVAARALQGIGGALLTPGSLAILQASFEHDDRSRAIGAWSGLAGIAGAIGPFLGGWLVQAADWRLVFLINLPVAAVVVWITVRHVPESWDTSATGQIDLAGAVVGVVALAGLTYGFTAWPERGLDGVVVASLVLGVVGMAVFVLVEWRSRTPMLPLYLFGSRVFSVTNVVTFAMYAALGGVFFLLVVQLQVVSGFSPLASGLALLPITILMLFLSSRAGALGQRIGPRLPMSLGPVICALSVLLLAGVDADVSYVVGVIGPVVVLGLGLSLTVAPLTATALAAADDRHAGIASGVNNAVARTGGLLAVAILPLLSGLGTSMTDPVALAPAYRTSMLICAALLLVSGLISYAFIPTSLGACRETAATPPGEERITRAAEASPVQTHCSINAPPLHPDVEHESV